MKGLQTLFGIILLLSIAVEAATAQLLAFTEVTVIDVVEGTAPSGMTVIVKGNRIAGVGRTDSMEIPAGSTIVVAAGKYLIPGLWDMHAHAARAGRAPRFWPLFLAHGVTGFREMGSYVDSLLYWREQAASPERRAPRIYWGAIVDGRPPVSPFHIVAMNATEAVAAVDSVVDLGLDFVKVYDRLSREAYFALAQRAKQRGISFAGHVPHDVTPVEATNAGQRSFEHVTELLLPCVTGAEPLSDAYGRAITHYGASSDSAKAAMERLMGVLAFTASDAAECVELLERMIANRTWLTPTLSVYKSETQPSSFEGDPRMRWVPAAIDKYWRESRRLTPEQEVVGAKIMDNALRTTGLAHRAGIPILAGTDASATPYIFAGSSLHDELSMYVEAGLSPLEALQTATLNPARFLGRTEDLGTIEEGKLADLILLDANPLEDITNTQRIRAVVTNGRFLDRETLDAMLAKVERLAKSEE